MTLRVRFAPSPTGYLHVGGARTALFNWLWARKNGGTFILRIEDTDKERSTDANTRSILEGLEWLELHWDEGPVLQSEGVERHKIVAHRLLREGKAYRSFLTPAELEEQRKAATAAKHPWLRDRAGRDLSAAESARRADSGEPFAIRFRVPDGEGGTRFQDQVYGTQERSYRDIEDFALLRPDGSPLYNHVVVCDDVEMRITDIIRGQDHLSNTHKQVLLYEAMDAAPPRFAHLPLINAPDRTKLSKRKHGEVVSVTTYRDRGFLPEAFRNFLALLGWSAGDDREFYTTDELVAAFTLEGIGRSNAILNFSETDPRQWTDRKAFFLNQQYMAKMPLPELHTAGRARAEGGRAVGRGVRPGRHAARLVLEGRRPHSRPLRHPARLRRRGPGLLRRRLRHGPRGGGQEPQEGAAPQGVAARAGRGVSRRCPTSRPPPPRRRCALTPTSWG